jgi:lipid A ethanolaminephosphotransferase
MLFISDHGESLGENKAFMHGLPIRLAPKLQYEIPFLVWTSKGFRKYKSQLPPVLEQHYIFHSVLNLLSIESPAYNPNYDIFTIQSPAGQ